MHFMRNVRVYIYSSFLSISVKNKYFIYSLMIEKKQNYTESKSLVN